tara:strand:+ start:124 stop:543 length:420 start_codon:yes stop_codon:yes gene_type:complete
MWTQKEIIIKNKSRGFHLITNEILKKLPELKKINIGILHIFINHTSASLTINENTDISVRTDFESHFNRIVPEKEGLYTHTLEGEDDMPAHLKTAILGNSLSIPIKNGNLKLGIWQGIFLCEHRNEISSRKITATINGE